MHFFANTYRPFPCRKSGTLCVITSSYTLVHSCAPPTAAAPNNNLCASHHRSPMAWSMALDKGDMWINHLYKKLKERAECACPGLP